MQTRHLGQHQRQHPTKLKRLPNRCSTTLSLPPIELGEPGDIDAVLSSRNTACDVSRLALVVIKQSTLW